MGINSSIVDSKLFINSYSLWPSNLKFIYISFAPMYYLQGEWPSGPDSSISLTEVKHGCVRSETGWATFQ